jgi:hypothetical protein
MDGKNIDQKNNCYLKERIGFLKRKIGTPQTKSDNTSPIILLLSISICFNTFAFVYILFKF